MVRLTANPRAIVPASAHLLSRPEEKYAQKKNPKGINPAILIPTFSQYLQPA